MSASKKAALAAAKAKLEAQRAAAAQQSSQGQQKGAATAATATTLSKEAQARLERTKSVASFLSPGRLFDPQRGLSSLASAAKNPKLKDGLGGGGDAGPVPECLYSRLVSWLGGPRAPAVWKDAVESSEYRWRFVDEARADHGCSQLAWQRYKWQVAEGRKIRQRCSDEIPPAFDRGRGNVVGKPGTMAWNVMQATRARLRMLLGLPEVPVRELQAQEAEWKATRDAARTMGVLRVEDPDSDEDEDEDENEDHESDDHDDKDANQPKDADGDQDENEKSGKPENEQAKHQQQQQLNKSQKNAKKGKKSGKHAKNQASAAQKSGSVALTVDWGASEAGSSSKPGKSDKSDKSGGSGDASTSGSSGSKAAAIATTIAKARKLLRKLKADPARERVRRALVRAGVWPRGRVERAKMALAATLQILEMGELQDPFAVTWVWEDWNEAVRKERARVELVVHHAGVNRERFAQLMKEWSSEDDWDDLDEAQLAVLGATASGGGKPGVLAQQLRAAASHQWRVGACDLMAMVPKKFSETMWLAHQAEAAARSGLIEAACLAETPNGHTLDETLARHYLSPLRGFSQPRS